MDNISKVLFVACLVLAGVLGFRIGVLMKDFQEIPPLEKQENTYNNTANITESRKKESEEWNVSFCPYCGSPFAYVDEVPRYIDANGIMHGDIYRIYECGHRVYMGEKTWRFYNFKPEVQEYYREYIKERGGEVYY